MWRRFLRRKQNWFGIALAALFAAVALAAPLLSPHDPELPGAFKIVGRYTDPIPHPPGYDAGAPLGTLPGQFDVYHALVWGARDAVRFGLSVAVGAFAFGVLYGAIAGYAGGGLNTLMMRIADGFLTFPPIAGAVFLMQLAASAIVGLGGQYFFNPATHSNVIFYEGPRPFLVTFVETVDPLLISLILFGWMPHARLVNSIVLVLKQSEFILAARAIGCSPWRVITRHLLPNAISPAIVLAARDVGSAVILQATMAVIGLGSSSPWGILLANGRNWIVGGVLTYWWVYAPATVLMLLFGITWNLIGDGLNDAL